MQLLRLIRYKNLFMIALFQCLLKYVFFELPQFKSVGLYTFLDATTFTCLVLSTFFLAASGYIINDIHDIEADTVNKPHKVVIGKGISENMANTLFIIFTIIGVILGTYVSWQIGKNTFATMFLIISALLYWYAIALKQTILIGNIVISFLVSMSILIIGIFEITVIRYR